MPAPPAEEESQFQQITAARKYIAEQALKQQAKKVSPPSPPFPLNMQHMHQVIEGCMSSWNGNN